MATTVGSATSRSFTGLGRAPGSEVIGIEGIDDACKRVEKGDVRFRSVIDMAS